MLEEMGTVSPDAFFLSPDDRVMLPWDAAPEGNSTAIASRPLA
jgi:hypothetical protein